LRRQGNTYGHAIGEQHQTWCRHQGKRDSLKGLTRCMGVRPDAWMRNAKPLLYTGNNDLSDFWEWRSLQRDTRDGSEDNALIKKVKTGFTNPRIVAELWLIAILSDGYAQPMMYAINEDEPDKNMLWMAPVVLRARMYLQDWVRGVNIPSLLFGWSVGHLGVPSTYTPAISDLICFGVDLLPIDTQIELACVSRQTHWNMSKWYHSNVAALSCLCTALLATFDRFVSEYLPGGILYKPSDDVAAIARACPPTNDHNERNLSMLSTRNAVAVNTLTMHKEARILASQNKSIEWLLSLPEAHRTRLLAATRKYVTEVRHTMAQRLQRDDELKRTRIAELTKRNDARRANRAAAKKRNDEIVLWASAAAMESGLASATSDSNQKELIKSQLRAIKQRFKLKKSKIYFSQKKRDLTLNELKQMLLAMIEQYVAPSLAASGSSPSPPPPPSPSANTNNNSADGVTTDGTAPPRKVSHLPRASLPLTSTPVPIYQLQTGKRGRPPSKSKRQSKKQSTELQEREVLSCCGEVERTGDELVHCDGCGRWQHCDCEDAVLEDVQYDDNYLCSNCIITAYEHITRP
jgi:hypothetical protein